MADSSSSTSSSPVNRGACGRGCISSTIRYFSTVILILVFCVSPSCKKQPKAEFPEQLGIEDYGRLPGLKGTSLEKLRNELARVVEQKGTPEILDGIGLVEGDSLDEPSASARPQIPDDINTAAGLADAFGKKTFDSLQETIDKLYPSGPFQFNALQLRTVVGFLARHQDELLRARKALQRPKCDFGIRHVRGFANDVSFIDRVRLAGRLEAFSAAKSLFTDDNPREATNALGNMMQWARLLGEQRHATARLQAAMLRAEAMEVLQAIVLHPRCKEKDLSHLHEIVHENLAEWPDDADAWIGDRALGMHCYEIVRDGAIACLLTPEEINEFAAIGAIEELPAAAKAVADEDELFYLSAMRKIIESCRQPYFQRANVATEILAQAAAKKNAPDYPLVADRLLLPDINRGLRMQAEDRATVESWAVALEAALGRPAGYTLNPLTGKKYRVSRNDKQVSVIEPENGEEKSRVAVVVPLH